MLVLEYDWLNFIINSILLSACDSGENFRSDDPCLPWCICKTEGRRGRRVCAKIKCSTAEMSDHCRLIQAEGHCCPKILCGTSFSTAWLILNPNFHHSATTVALFFVETSNLTTSVLYNLPWIVLPPDMFEMNSVIPEGSSN